MKCALPRLVALGAIILGLAACGGGGNKIASTPMPQSSAPPPPPPPPPPPTAKPPFGVTSDTSFATVGANVEFRWVESAKAYEIQFAGQPAERLGLVDSNSNYEYHYPSSGFNFISVIKDPPYQYTNIATQADNSFGGFMEEFAFGIPTAPGDVPVTGSASYTAAIFGSSGYFLSGDAKLSFDFGTGSLAGYMNPKMAGPTGILDLGRYDFTQTVYSTGSTSFSGRFIVPGGGSTADSGFSGLFTGPQAAELMAEFHAPFIDPLTTQWSNFSGLWIGKKD